VLNEDYKELLGCRESDIEAFGGKDECAIKAICEAFLNDQIQNIDRLIDTDYRYEEVGRFVLSEICSIAPHFKRGK